LLADIAILLQNARFARIAKDYIQLRKLYSLQQIAAIYNNAPKKKIPDVAVKENISTFISKLLFLILYIPLL